MTKNPCCRCRVKPATTTIRYASIIENVCDTHAAEVLAAQPNAKVLA